MLSVGNVIAVSRYIILCYVTNLFLSCDFKAEGLLKYLPGTKSTWCGVIIDSLLISANLMSSDDKLYVTIGSLRLILVFKVSDVIPKCLPKFISYFLQLSVSSLPMMMSKIFTIASLMVCIPSGTVCLMASWLGSLKNEYCPLHPVLLVMKLATAG